MKRKVLTACPLDCWDACSVIAHVEDGRVTGLQGNPSHPITRGFLCGRTMRYPLRVYSAARILHPMLRKPGDERVAADAFEEIPWDRALDLAAAKIREAVSDYGPLSLLHMQGGGSMGILKKLSGRFFRLLGGFTEPAGGICFGAGEHAMVQSFGEQTAHSPEDIPNSRLVVLWGRDPFVSNTHLLPFLDEARQRGAQVVSINPRKIEAVERHLDWQLQPAPGRDVFLALALLREFIGRGWCDETFLATHTTGWETFREYVAARTSGGWLEESGIARRDFHRLLSLYHDCRPAAIWAGSGVQHNLLGVEVMHALSALAAAAGNLGVAGGGVTFFLKHRKAFDLAWVKNPCDTPAAIRGIPAGEFWKFLPGLDPPIRLMWINAMNPVRSLPDSSAVAAAIRAVPFSVAVDFHWTDTVRCADLVLPHTSFLEETDVMSSYGQNYVALLQPAAERVGEARTDLEIFQALAERLGCGEPMRGSEREWIERFMAPLFAADSALREKVYRDGFVENPGVPRVPHQGGQFSTHDGRFHFPAVLDLALERLPSATAGFPLRLITSKNKRVLNSQELKERERERYEVRVRPETAARLGLDPGRSVVVRSKTGSVPALLAVDETLHPETAWMAVSGSLGRGNCVNQLTDAQMARDGACPAYNDTFVRIDSDSQTS